MKSISPDWDQIHKEMNKKLILNEDRYTNIELFKNI